MQEPRGSEGDPLRASGDYVRAGLWFYGAMLAVALVWRMGFYRESVLYASAEASERGVDLGPNFVAGALTGLCVVAVSHWLTRGTGWGERLARELAAALGPLSVPDALLLAVASGLAEEALFRGALQPRVGLRLASLLFGAVHFLPRRVLLPWTGFAVGAGLLFGLLFEWTGNLVAPVVAHTVVNAVNLPMLVRRYGRAAAIGVREDDPD